MRLLIAVATYNEIENLPPLATAIRDRLGQSLEFVVVAAPCNHGAVVESVG